MSEVVDLSEVVDQRSTEVSGTASRSLPHRWLTGSILWYQRARHGRPSPCRFFPSCSSYALEAVEVHGARRGSWLAVKRLVRCRPLGPSGFDPVPEPMTSPRSCEHTHAGTQPGTQLDSSPDPLAGQR